MTTDEKRDKRRKINAWLAGLILVALGVAFLWSSSAATPRSGPGIGLGIVLALAGLCVVLFGGGVELDDDGDELPASKFPGGAPAKGPPLDPAGTQWVGTEADYATRPDRGGGHQAGPKTPKTGGAP